MASNSALPPNDTNWKIFEIRRKNLLSISKAQRIHLTTLLIEIALFWVWYISGSRDITVQGVALTARGVWVAAPVLFSYFCLAFIGSVNAALPAKKALEQSESAIGFSGVAHSGFAFYDLDTDKNVLDYFTFLKLSPTNNEFSQDRKFDPRHFLYPAAMAASMCTTVFTWRGFSSCRGHLFVLICVAVQLLFWIRPATRAFLRFVGHHVDN